MKYQCMNENCQATFDHTGKRTEYDFNEFPYLEAKSIAFLHPGDKVVVASFEYPVCPFCGTKAFREYIEPPMEISSVKSVPLEEVDTWIAQGYSVKELYAKNAVLVKKEVKV